MFYKLISGGMIVDLLQGAHYVRYLSKAKRWINTDSQSANGIMGSDNNTVYKIQGRFCSCPESLKTVEIYQIGPEEYESLSIQFAIQKQENEDLRNEIKKLHDQLNDQNLLLQQILAKL